MRILAIDTATRTMSVAIYDLASHSVIASAVREVVTHSDALLPAVRETLDAARLQVTDVDAVAVGEGPGSFTGLRIGLSCAKGLAFAAGKELWGASSLAALANAAQPQDNEVVVPLLDARRDEVYAGFYTADGIALSDEIVIAPNLLVDKLDKLRGDRQLRFVGDALELYGQALAAHGRLDSDSATVPPALDIAIVAARTRRNILMTGGPKYIRPSEAEIRFPDGNTGGTFSQS